MSAKSARIHTQASNRERPRVVKESKTVFKSVLDNPFRVQWPSIPVNFQASALTLIVQLLEGVSEYHSLNRKRKRKLDHCSKNGKRRKAAVESLSSLSSDLAGKVNAPEHQQHQAAEGERDRDPVAPRILPHLVFGINEVTKRLESQLQSLRHPLVFPLASTSEGIIHPLKYVFVCRADVDPPLLIDHIPHLIAACNSSQSKERITVIPLPKGAEQTLARMLGVRRVTILAIDSGFPDAEALESAFVSVPLLTAPWLSQSCTNFVPTHIKHIRTTAPQDMKLAKETRLSERRAAKAKKSSVKKAPPVKT